MTNRLPVRLIFGLVTALGAAAVSAHHSFSAEFDVNKPLKVTGTVTKLEWANPHAWFYVDVKDDGGNVSSWAFELASPNLLLRNGWTRSALTIGEAVTVEGYQAKNGTNNANASSVTIVSTGQALFTGSSRKGSGQ